MPDFGKIALNAASVLDSAMATMRMDTTGAASAVAISKNLFDASTSTINQSISPDSGSTFTLAGYYASAYIPVEELTNYAFTKVTQGAFYDSSKKFINSSTINLSPPADAVRLSPKGAAFCRVGFRADYWATVAQVEKGLAVSSYQAYGAIIKRPSIPDLYPSYSQNVMAELRDPFVRTRLKMLGDSITHGQGGTGFTNNVGGGPDIAFNFWFENTNGYCWANLLRDHVIATYAREYDVPVNHAKIIVSSQTTIGTGGYTGGNPQNTQTRMRKKATFANTVGTFARLSFTFYGDHFGVYHTNASTKGIFAIYVDGVFKQNVDCYSASAAFKTLTAVTGLTLGEHLIEIRETNSKNASSTLNEVVIEGFKIPKTVTSKNWGTAGVDSRWMAENIDVSGLLEPEDTIVILMIGTNDRVNATSGQETKNNILETVAKIEANGSRCVMMSSIPAGLTNEDDFSLMHMNEIEEAVKEAAVTLGRDYVSNYNDMLDYMDMKGVTLATLTGDSLHPNDAGYLVMFKNITKRLGIARKIDSAPW